MYQCLSIFSHFDMIEIIKKNNKNEIDGNIMYLFENKCLIVSICEINIIILRYE